MKNRAARSFLVLVGLLTVSLPLVAHHGNAQYKSERVTLKGTVTQWLWMNPHCFLKVDVKDANGKVVNWVAELVPPSTMVNFGFTAKTFKPGDQVTLIAGSIAKNGAPVARLGDVILANGQVMRIGGALDGNALQGAGRRPPADSKDSK
jgi:hypothetical protein